MEKDLNLIKLLKDAPKGTKLYSPIFGECELREVHKDTGTICIKAKNYAACFNEDGTYLSDCGDCLLFPSKENRDWSSFKVEKGFQVGDHLFHIETKEVYFLLREGETGDGFWAKRINSSSDCQEIYITDHELEDYVGIIKFNHNWLNTYDRVLVRDSTTWFATFFSHYEEGESNNYVASNGRAYKCCVPYNEETKHLVGTEYTEPEFYKID